jgi:hypothetical protein
VTDLGRAAAGVFAAVVLGGCGIPEAERHLETLPDVPTLPSEPGQTVEVLPPPPPVSWDGDGRLAVVTYGSSSCPTAPADVTVAGDQELVLHIAPLHPDQDPCTADVAPRTTEVEVPDGVSSGEELTVRLRYPTGEEETVVLPPAGR